ANNGHKNEKDLNDLQKILENSQFPKNIKNRIKKEVNDNLSRSNNVNNNQQCSGIVVIPHLNGITERLKRDLKKHQIKTFTQHSKSIGSILNKTKLIALNKLGTKKKDSTVFAKNAIYGIPGKCGCIYVGETEDFERRHKQHMSNVKYHRVNESEIVQHLLVSNSSCNIQFEKSLIFDREENKHRRKVLEAVYSIANKSYNNKRMICNQWKASISKWIGEKSVLNFNIYTDNYMTTTFYHQSQQFSFTHLKLVITSNYETVDGIAFLFKYLSKLQYLTFECTGNTEFLDGYYCQRVLSTSLIQLKTFHLYIELYYNSYPFDLNYIITCFQNKYYRDHNWHFEYVYEQEKEHFRFYSLPYYQNEISIIDKKICETKSTMELRQLSTSKTV
ncbi:unnamed protein product, partial [Didymodactylos carnosus]